MIEENEGGGHSVSLEANGSHRLVGFVSIPPYGLAVQIGFIDRADNIAGVRYSRLETFLLDPGTGRGVSLGSQIPPLAVADARLAISWQDDPVPQLMAWTMKPRE